MQGMEKLGLADRVTFLHVREHDLYRWLIECDAGAAADLRSAVLAWLAKVRPTQIFGDAYEATNVTHDLGRAVLDSAWREYVESRPLREFRTTPGVPHGARVVEA